MNNPTFNGGIDYFGLVAASQNKLAVQSSNENRSKQSANGPNTYGDVVVVDSYGETAAPSAEYMVVGDLTTESFPHLGTVQTVEAIEKPVVRGTLTINTQSGNPPTCSMSGQMVQTGATQLRDYPLPAGIALSPRHRAQDFIGAMSIKKGSADASDETDYGLESVSGTFPIEITTAMPKGELKNYDLHGGEATVNYTMNWYASTAPTIALSSTAAAAGYTMSQPVSKNCPEGGYIQYTWTVSLQMVGEEYTPESED